MTALRTAYLTAGRALIYLIAGDQRCRADGCPRWAGRHHLLCEPHRKAQPAVVGRHRPTRILKETS